MGCSTGPICLHPLQVRVFHEQVAETREEILSKEKCFRSRQAAVAHSFTLDTLQNTMSRSLKMQAATPTLSEIQKKVSQILEGKLGDAEKERYGAADEEDDDSDEGGDRESSPPAKKTRASTPTKQPGAFMISIGAKKGAAAAQSGRKQPAAKVSPPAGGGGPARPKSRGRGLLPGPSRRPRVYTPSPERQDNPGAASAYAPAAQPTAQAAAMDSAEVPSSQPPASLAGSLATTTHGGKAKKPVQTVDDRAAGYRAEALRLAPGVLTGFNIEHRCDIYNRFSCLCCLKLASCTRGGGWSRVGCCDGGC